MWFDSYLFEEDDWSVWYVYMFVTRWIRCNRCWFSRESITRWLQLYDGNSTVWFLNILICERWIFDILMICCDVGHRQSLKLCQDLKMHKYFAKWCVQDWISVNLGTRSRFEVREIGFRWILVRDKGPYTVHSGKEWGFELNSKKEWGFEIDIASNVKRLVNYEEL